MTTQSSNSTKPVIEFATNRTGSWFVASTDQSAVNAIKLSTAKFNVNAGNIQQFNHCGVIRYVIYFNQSRLNEEFYRWVRTNFDIRNQKRAKAAESIRQRKVFDAEQLACRIQLNKFPVLTIKKAMLELFGDPEKIVEMSYKCRVKFSRPATKHQCLQLILTMGVGSEMIDAAKSIQSQKPVEQSDKDEVRAVYAEVVLEDPFETVKVEYVSIDQVDAVIEKAVKLLVGQQPKLLVAGIESNNTVHVWTEKELMAMTKRQMRQLAKDDGVNLFGTSQLRKADLAMYIADAFRLIFQNECSH